MFSTVTAPSPASRCTGSVASAYSPVPGISATARSGTSPGASAARNTSKLNCGTRLPKAPSARSSNTT
ncbi:hypothetical protein SAMN04488238_102222 [Roseicitreum antarcticum]|uniref:Uncharacterized protein n=1 Tax=Roseicitreum antarcticum TaxID=564137 RepID=A0A1H2TYA6_9RHOB|nr:hypothetical protein SAMN04488238_102222 [Roseicitreum antarcticum]